MKELFIGMIAVLAFFAVVNTAGIALKSYRCGQRWGDYEHRYSVFGGCQVKEDDKWTPEGRVLAVQ